MYYIDFKLISVDGGIQMEIYDENNQKQEAHQ